MRDGAGSGRGAWGRAAAAFAAAALLAAPAAGQRKAPLTALAKLERGLWQLRDLDDPRAAPRSICLSDPEAIVQIQHPGAPCARLVLADAGTQATVHYTCPQSGFGRTSVRVETPRLVKVDTQGIMGNAPFALRAEARRIGACSPSP